MYLFQMNYRIQSVQPRKTPPLGDMTRGRKDYGHHTFVVQETYSTVKYIHTNSLGVSKQYYYNSAFTIKESLRSLEEQSVNCLYGFRSEAQT